jgi:hypothetical protein
MDAQEDVQDGPWMKTTSAVKTATATAIEGVLGTFQIS